MAEVVLFHSALGLRPGVHAIADILREAGHTVTLPDYYDGEYFDDLDGGLRKRDSLGFPELTRRFRKISETISRPTVFAGFSLGAMAAQLLAATHPAARGAVLLHGAGRASEFTDGPWPSAVPVQVHYAENDPWMDPEEVDDLRAAVTAAGAAFEAYTYPGDAHLFTDPGLPEHDPESAALIWRRVLAFLDGR
jgi:Dienelactone hydrolase and related enzymes